MKFQESVEVGQNFISLSLASHSVVYTWSCSLLQLLWSAIIPHPNVDNGIDILLVPYILVSTGIVIEEGRQRQRDHGPQMSEEQNGFISLLIVPIPNQLCLVNITSLES